MDLLSAAFSNIWSIFLVVVFFGGSIFVHELGHFLAARRRGVHVERFSIGFGPAIWSYRAKDGVEYRIAWFPLGGYVLLPQLADLGAIEGESTADVAKLPPISYSTKMIVFVAGAAFNVLFAFALACIITAIGVPESSMTATTRVGYVAKTLEGPDGTKTPSPALTAGFRAGDIVRAIDGKPVADWQDLMQTLITTTGRAAAHLWRGEPALVVPRSCTAQPGWAAAASNSDSHRELAGSASELRNTTQSPRASRIPRFKTRPGTYSWG